MWVFPYAVEYGTIYRGFYQSVKATNELRMEHKVTAITSIVSYKA